MTVDESSVISSCKSWKMKITVKIARVHPENHNSLSDLPNNHIFNWMCLNLVRVMLISMPLYNILLSSGNWYTVGYCLIMKYKKIHVADGTDVRFYSDIKKN